MKILIIEDEPELLSALEWGLQELGYTTDTAEDGPIGLEKAICNTYDVVVLDMNLPGMDGMEVLAGIRRENPDQKVLILSARSTVPDKVAGLNAGANDYLAKPFEFAELDARIQNLLRRQFTQQKTVLESGNLRIDTLQRRATGPAGKGIDLTHREYAILEYLMRNLGRPVSAEELFEHIWDEESDPFSSAVKVRMSALRKKLAKAGVKDLIGNIRGTGYIIEKEAGA